MAKIVLLLLTIVLTGALFAWAAKAQHRVETDVSRRVHLMGKFKTAI